MRIDTLEKQNAALNARLDALENVPANQQNVFLLTPLLVIALGAGVWLGKQRGNKK
jgi:hypothetical protein